MRYRHPIRRWAERLLIRLTHKIWNRIICRCLIEAEEGRLINDAQFHGLHTYFDPTQRHSVYRKHDREFEMPYKRRGKE